MRRPRIRVCAVTMPTSPAMRAAHNPVDAEHSRPHPIPMQHHRQVTVDVDDLLLYGVLVHELVRQRLEPSIPRHRRAGRLHQEQ